MAKTKFQPGDVLAFSGSNAVSDLINLMTYGIPRFSISHVGIVGADGKTLYESTIETGVHVEPIEPYNYRGKIWHYALRTSLSLAQWTELDAYLRREVGKPYDLRGAMRAGLKVFSLINSRIHAETKESLFCSEYVARGLSLIGRFNTGHTSRWSPNAFIREANRQGLFKSPIRVQ